MFTKRWGGVISAYQGRNTKDQGKGPRVNDEITANPVRLIGADGQQVGIVDLRKALREAESEGLDLVEIAPGAKPPVCKVIDYGKYRYELSKKEKDARKKQHVVQVKRVQLSPNIDIHDFNVKAAAARRFIEAGHRVMAILMMRGRQVTRKDLAEEVLLRLQEELSDIAIPEGTIKMEGHNRISLVLVKRKK